MTATTEAIAAQALIDHPRMAEIVRHRDRAASFALLLWTVAPDTGGQMVFDILEPKARYASSVWSKVRRHALAGRFVQVNVLHGGPSGAVVRRIRAVNIETAQDDQRAAAFGLLALAARCRQSGAVQDARLILADLRQSRAATVAPMAKA